jgi:cytochrome c-type biogenesis protein CcmH
MIGRVLLVVMLLVVAGGRHGWAVEPSERLADAALEARARAISQELRCLVCQNESIDESNAPLAHDLRLLVRKRLLAGDSDRQVVSYVVARYGVFVRLVPPFEKVTWVLWLGPPVLVGAAVVVFFFRTRRWSESTPPPELTPTERERAAALLGDRA